MTTVNIEIVVYFIRSIQMGANFYMSMSGRGRFTRLPFKLQPKNFCTLLDVDYRKNVMPWAGMPVTDFIYSENPNESLCQMFKMNGPVS